MIELKEGVDIIRVEDVYYWVWFNAAYIQIECEGEAWAVQSIDEFLEEIDCIGCEITQYQLVKL